MMSLSVKQFILIWLLGFISGLIAAGYLYLYKKGV